MIANIAMEAAAFTLLQIMKTSLEYIQHVCYILKKATVCVSNVFFGRYCKTLGLCWFSGHPKQKFEICTEAVCSYWNCDADGMRFTKTENVVYRLSQILREKLPKVKNFSCVELFFKSFKKKKTDWDVIRYQI